MAIRMAADGSRTTHGAHEAVDACRYMAGLLIGALQNVSKDQLLSSHFEPLTGVWQDKALAPKIAHMHPVRSSRKIHHRSGEPAMSSRVLRPHCGPSTGPILFRMRLYRQSTSVMTRIRRARSAVSSPAPS